MYSNDMYPSDIDSTCSTPYVSAPSSPGRIPAVGGGVGGFFYSAPTSPMHYMLFSPPSNTTNSTNYAPHSAAPNSASGSSFEFDFSARFGNTGPASDGSMISADELFCNGQIRPMKLSTHLQRPQVLAPLLDLDEIEDEGEKFLRGRDVKWRDRSLRRRTRSMSPLRSSSFGWHDDDDDEEEEDQKTDKMKNNVLGVEEIEIKENEAAASSDTTPSASASSSRSSSVSRSSKRWVFLKEFLYRSKSEGRNNTNNNNSHKFWTSVAFSPVKDKKVVLPEKKAAAKQEKGKEPKKALNGVRKRRGTTASAHELHYKANREKTEEMKKKTFLPYRQGLIGCLGFSSKSYGAMNGFARALNPVSSR